MIALYKIYAGNFPLLIPVFRYLFSKTKEGQDGEKLVKIALELVQARKRGGKKVRLSMMEFKAISQY